MATTTAKATHFTNKRLTMVQKEKLQASGYDTRYKNLYYEFSALIGAHIGMA